jgi:hypothetical protein
MRYLTVESASPEERRREGRAGGRVNGAGWVTARGGEFATAFDSCYQRVADDLRAEIEVQERDFGPYFFIGVKVINR